MTADESTTPDTTEEVAVDEVDQVEEATPAKEPEVTDDTVTMTKAEADALRRELAERRRQAKQAEKEAAVAERKRLEEEGQYQTLAKQAEERAAAAEARAKELETRQLITQVANRLRFRDAQDAIAHLRDRGIDAEDEAAVEGALNALATEKSYLIDTPAVVKTGGSVGGEGQTNLTVDELRGMTPEQINQLDPAEVNRVLSQQ